METENIEKNVEEQSVQHSRLIIFKKKDKKKKKKYSKRLKNVQKSSEKISKASSRMANAVADGIDQYRNKRDKSARKKRDGAIKDFLPNFASGISKTLRKSSLVPVDLAKAVNTKRARKRVKRTIRIFR